MNSWNTRAISPGRGRALRTAIATLAVAAAWSAMVAGQQPNDPRSTARDAEPLAALVAWHGPESKVTERTYLRIDDREAWEALWRRALPEAGQRDHLNRPVVPEVDFARCSVLALFDGSGRNSNGLRLVSIEEIDDGVRVRFDKLSYQTASGGPEDRGIPVTPFGIFVVPKLPADGRPVLLEQNVQNLIGGPPVWRERARL